MGRIAYTNLNNMFGPPCSNTDLVTVQLPGVGPATVNRKVAHQFVGAFAEASQVGLIKSYDGIYNCRRVKLQSGGFGKEYSRHAWAIAADINAAEFYYGSRKRQNPQLDAIFSKWGFENALDWGINDPMHYEVVKILVGTVPVLPVNQPQPAIGERNLKIGDRGEDVRTLQNQLNGLHFRAGNPDTIFGKNTDGALRRFQLAAGITVDGIAGPATKRALTTYQRPDFATFPVLRRRDKNTAVGHMQRFLQLHWFNLAVDGNFGPMTEKCVKTFQGSRGLNPDGIVGKNTWEALHS